MNNQPEITMYGEGQVSLMVLNREDLKNMLNVVPSSVHAFPLNIENEIILTLNHRGVDLIGGHIEKGENPEQALIRECMEKACLIPLKYELIGAIQVDNSKNPSALKKGYPTTGYQFFYKITHFELEKFKQTHESHGIVNLALEEAQEKHHNWLKSYTLLFEMSLLNDLNLKQRSLLVP